MYRRTVTVSGRVTTLLLTFLILARGCMLRTLVSDVHKILFSSSYTPDFIIFEILIANSIRHQPYCFFLSLFLYYDHDIV
jgi:hypothetical protein